MNISYIGSQEFGAWIKTTTAGVDASPSLTVQRHTHETLFVDLLLVDGEDDVGDADSHASLVARVLSPDAPEGRALHAQEYVLLRGAHEEKQLRTLLEVAEARREIRNLSQSISGPFAHDVRGVIGVANLAAQVLSANEQNAAMSKKLFAVGFKMSELLETLQTLPQVTREEDEADSIQESCASMVESIEAWFGATHRSRNLEMDPGEFASGTSRPLAVKVILRGMIDACARHSPREVPVKVRAKFLESGDEFEVSVREFVSSDEQRFCLLAAPSSWIPAHVEGVPWRLWVAQQLAAELDSQLNVTCTAQGLILRFKRGSQLAAPAH